MAPMPTPVQLRLKLITCRVKQQTPEIYRNSTRSANLQFPGAQDNGSCNLSIFCPLHPVRQQTRIVLGMRSLRPQAPNSFLSTRWPITFKKVQRCNPDNILKTDVLQELNNQRRIDQVYPELITENLNYVTLTYASLTVLKLDIT